MTRFLCVALAAAGALAAPRAAPAPGAAFERDFSPFHRTRTVVGADGVRRSTVVAPPEGLLGGAAAGAAPVGAELQALANATAGDRDGWPEFVGTLLPGAAPLRVKGACFENTTMALFPPAAGGNAHVHVDYEGAVSSTCSDIYLLITATHWSVQYNYFHGAEDVEWFPMANAADRADLMHNGIRVVMWSGAWYKEAAWMYKMFNVLVREDETEIVDFLASTSEIKFAPRENVQLLPKAGDILPGDVLGAWHPTATQTSISWVTGRAVGHGVMVLEFDGELYACETNTPDELNGFVDGIQRHPLAAWLDARHKTGMTVWWMRLDAAARAAFDNERAAAWFLAHEGEGYGYPVLVGTALDAVNAYQLPPPITTESILPLVALAQHAAGDYVKKAVFAPFNARMKYYFEKDVACGSVECMVGAARAVNSTALDVLAMVETEALQYPIFSHKTNRTENRTAYVCDTLVVKMLQVGGALSDLAIEPNEFTPRDLSELAIFAPKLDYCDSTGNDYTCTLIGPWVSDLKGMGEQKPYSHMNERCGMTHPAFDKFPAGC